MTYIRSKAPMAESHLTGVGEMYYNHEEGKVVHMDIEIAKFNKAIYI